MHRTLNRMLLPALFVSVASSLVAKAFGGDAPPPAPPGDHGDASSLVAAAEENPAAANPLSAFNKRAYVHMKDWVLKSAEKMPEAGYGFRPTPAVRTFGQVLGHVADMQYIFCSCALGEKPVMPKIEQTKTSKEEVVAALRDAFAYCDKAYDGMTDSAGAQTVKLFGREELPRLGVLQANVAHVAEHYGNVSTYLRMKDLVPPSTEERQAAAAAAGKK